jgi:peptidoglycan/xylan/chitin deacetylase (PgdA/CDA1 family)
MRTVSLLFHDVYATDPRESGFGSDAADRYKLSVDAFDAHLDAIAGADAGAGRAPFLITVDDGGVSYYTKLAERLEARGWRGYCFVSTDQIGTRGFLDAAQIRELDRRGHLIGSHSASHPTRFSACTPARMREEWTVSRRVLEDIVGHDVTVASVPGGYYSKAVARSAAESGVTMLFNSEPVTSVDDVDGCSVAGRFTIRRGDPPDMSRRLLLREPWARWSAWTRWNAKGLAKPILGPAYMRVADLVAGHE